jgi:hypothetical protein
MPPISKIIWITFLITPSSLMGLRSVVFLRELITSFLGLSTSKMLWDVFFSTSSLIVLFLSFIMVFSQIDLSIEWLFYPNREKGVTYSLKFFRLIYSDPTNDKPFVLSIKERVYHMIFGYLLMLFAFANFYQLLSVWSPKSFNDPMNILNSLYFSIITSATIGYGDIVPKGFLPRLIVSSEVLLSLGYVVLILSIIPSYFKEKNIENELETRIVQSTKREKQTINEIAEDFGVTVDYILKIKEENNL